MTEPTPNSPNKKPGNGLLGWLGRQVGYVKKAVGTDVGGPKTIYRERKVEEKPLPQDPKVKLRRTVIDEVVVEPDRPGDKKT
jgi:hypothetical protein